MKRGMQSKIRLKKHSDILISKVSSNDIKESINYAILSLPWTFDRMHYGNETQKSVNKRLINIMKGVLNQTLLQKLLEKKGYTCKKNWKNYRDSDVFDFEVNNALFDVKTFHIYEKYTKSVKRSPFSTKLLIKNMSYPGPVWKTFFPVMVTLSQVQYNTEKYAYIFGISVTKKDLRQTTITSNSDGFWCATPFGNAHMFFQDRKLILLRERTQKGFRVVIARKKIQKTLLNNNSESVRIQLFGEWKGKPISDILNIKMNEKNVSKKLFSSLSCVRLIDNDKANEFDKFYISVDNSLKDFVEKSNDPSINLNDDKFVWEITTDSLVDLLVPSDYKVYWLGYIPFNEFYEKLKNYRCYFAVKPGTDSNVDGNITPKMKDKFRAMDKRRSRAIENGINVNVPEFMPFIRGKKINAGMLLAVTTAGGRNIGASCYFYPPYYPFFDTALYVLPKDLYTINSL
jgi:hypothetical protein